MLPTNNFLPLPSPLTAPVTKLQTDLTIALSDARGVVGNISSIDVDKVVQDVVALNDAAAPLIALSDATVASPARDAVVSGAAAQVIVQRPKNIAVFLRVINPNLFLLAARYLGDARRWQDVAQASGMALDPQPNGTFSIIIPSS